MKLSFHRSSIFISAILFIAMRCCGQQPMSQTLQLIDSGFIFSNPQFESCHASTLVALPGNKVVAAWFGGKQEGDISVCIWMSAKQKKGWTPSRMIADGVQPDNKKFPCWNPVLFYSRSGLLFLYYKVGLSPATWWGEVKVSKDSGKTWSDAKKLPDGFLGPIKNKPIQLRNGDILCPSSVETSSYRKWTIHLERCDSNGNNWKKINIDCDSFNVIQPTLLTYPDGRLQLLCRSRENVIVQSWSVDGGNTWQQAKASSLPNPNSGIDALTLASGKQLLVYNPLVINSNGRSVLKVAVSSDGLQWKNIFTLEDHTEGEFSYPAVIQTRDGIIHISYTHQRKNIKYVELKE